MAEIEPTDGMTIAGELRMELKFSHGTILLAPLFQPSPGVVRAAKPDVVRTIRRTRVHAFGRGDPNRRIIPTAAAHYFSRAAIRPFRVAYFVGRKGFREPIRHPLPDIASK